MVCLKANINRLVLFFLRVRSCNNVTASITHKRNINATTIRRTSIKAKSKRCARINARCGIVCSIGTASTLKVNKEYVWLMPENMFDDSFVIYSNVDWVIN